MKLIIEHPVVGKFQWELPASVGDRFGRCDELYRKGGEESSVAGGDMKRIILDDQGEKITAFLALLVAGLNMQKPSAVMQIIDEALKDATLKVAKVALE